MLLDADELLVEANAEYQKAKTAKYGVPCPDRQIASDQVKAVLTVLVRAINSQLLNPIVVHVDADDGDV